MGKVLQLFLKFNLKVKILNFRGLFYDDLFDLQKS